MKPRSPKTPPLTPEQKETIIKLFLAGGDNRTRVIAAAVGISEFRVSKIIDNYFLEKKSLT